MLRNFITTTFRSLLKNKGFTFLNIFGLALGLATCLLIVFYVADELSYDRYHVKADRIYRVDTDLKYGEAINNFAIAAPPLADALVHNFPVVEKAIRLSPNLNTRFRKGEEVVREDRVFYADPDLFDVFTLPLIYGNSKTALASPDAIVITESIAIKYFNTIDVLGNTLMIVGDTTVRNVTAVISDMPESSHFHADFFLSMNALPSARNTNFNQFSFNTYVLLKEGTDAHDLEANFPAFLKKHLNNNMNMDAFEKGGNYIRINLTPLIDIHLQSNRQRELEPNGDIQYIYIFSAVAALILFLACINFMNLSTARSANRAREVGVRKVLGSLRRYLIFQFLSESVLLTLFATIAAAIAAWALLPFFNQISGKNLMVTVHSLRWMIPAMFGIVLIVGVLAGFYPAFFLSGFQPIHVLKGKLSSGFKSSKFRSILVVFQFCISTFLITSTLVIYNQLTYIRNKDLGFDREQVLIIKNVSVLDNPEILKDEVKALTGVADASLSGYLPTGGARWLNGISSGDQHGQLSEFWLVDPDYLSTMGMKLLKGRNFSEARSTDSTAIIINEAAADMLGYSKDPLDHIIHTGQGDKAKDYRIIGVIRDFNFNSLRDNITPLVMILGSDWRASLNIRVEPGHLTSVLQQLKHKWKSLIPDQEFDYSFMSKDFEAIYNTEQRMEKLFMIFTLLAIVIACLGLFGLSAYAAQQRSREISIRKVLGATISGLFALLSKDFIKLVLIALCITAPLAWIAMEKWLQSFAYRQDIPLWAFIFSGAVTVIIAVVTISFQSLKAALVNPVENLRGE